MENIKAFTVTEVNLYLRQLLEKDLLLSHIYVKGEISNLKIHSSGHVYFSLKDRESRIKCVMFKSSFSRLKFLPEEGMQVIVRGYLSIYERDGQYQLYAEGMIAEGAGELYKAYEQLKNRLEIEGLFDKEHKKPLPLLPGKVGIVTSATGAALRDMISIGRRRNPNIDIYLYPTLVQGEKASEEICEGINYFNRFNKVDVIIVGRGGGSIEELWCFNEEIVARTIYESDIPVVSAVGHETDFTIADFAADVRAATPSAAAELVFPDKQQLYSYINKLQSHIYASMLSYIRDKKILLNKLTSTSSIRYTETKILNLRQSLQNMKEGLDTAMKDFLQIHRNNLYLYNEKLNILNPASYLNRGYAYVKKEETGELVKTIKMIHNGDVLNIYLKDGYASAIVRTICEGD
ncbi:exodeoxyribonuclease VII large subunit [Lutispora saccharofermentans]|uniref:Exodeoxyribonuclease 7 large subunit n=1 Tax=Lutispora saccharofermentans TaxID=3024236 RepID=A0ABT1NIX3_9FIRM|nr:exodeoxyribonuclease VII large subunit [Lutispora saccharofermentans]MCQ1529831.1 exodeoxyribonuclease VII large subunit [Lutispora saccharofermentans]